MSAVHPWNGALFGSIVSRKDRLAHALLVQGPRGVGKLALAEALAQAMLCEASAGAHRPCGRCEACRWFAAGSHPDFRRLEPEALAKPAAGADEEAEPAPARRGKPSLEIKVDQVRELADFVNVGSHRGGRRVALVHPAEDMNLHAANSLLKSLEEPPGAAMFILVSHRPGRLLATIRSRCVALPVPIPPREQALQWLSGQGVKEAERWLSFAGGAPLAAADAAALADRLLPILRALQARDRDALAAIDERQDMEAVIDLLQKLALDTAWSALGLAPKYGLGSLGGAPADAQAWLAFSRAMGRNRALARHPLNPRLFIAEMLAAMPR